MILADTSVWIDYFREDLQELSERLRRHEVVMHPFVVGELACGNFSNRESILELLQYLHSVTVAEHDEVMTFVRAQKLYGRGVGYVDVHLHSLPRLLTDASFGPWTSDSMQWRRASG